MTSTPTKGPRPQSRWSGSTNSIESLASSAESTSSSAPEPAKPTDVTPTEATIATEVPPSNLTTITTDAHLNTTQQHGPLPLPQLKPLIKSLCTSLSLPTPTRIHRIRGGAHNRIIGLDFDQPATNNPPTPHHPPLILRIPRKSTATKTLQSIKDQAAVLHLLELHACIPAPKAIAHDATGNNPLGAQYILQERIAGVPLGDVWSQMTLDHRKIIVDDLVKIIAAMERVTFPVCGVLTAGDIVPDTLPYALSQELPTTTTTTTTEVKGIGVGRDSTFRETQAGATLMDLLESQLYGHKKLHHDRGGNGSCWRELERIFYEMVELGWFDEVAKMRDEKNVLVHWDLEMWNIVVSLRPTEDGMAMGKEQYRITALLDWDDCLSLPLPLARQPPAWLWHFQPHPASDTIPWYPKGEEIQIQQYFDHKIAEVCEEYCVDAYGERGEWVRRYWGLLWKGIEDREKREEYKSFVRDWRRKWGWTFLCWDSDYWWLRSGCCSHFYIRSF